LFATGFLADEPVGFEGLDDIASPSKTKQSARHFIRLGLMASIRPSPNERSAHVTADSYVYTFSCLIHERNSLMVVLRPAYSWDCPDCDRENFCRGIVPEFSEEELAEMRAEQGVQPWEEGDFLMMPDSVECEHCHAVFETTHFKDA
jgi:hypothetical protein